MEHYLEDEGEFWLGWSYIVTGLFPPEIWLVLKFHPWLLFPVGE